MLNVSFKFLIMLRICSRLTKSTNVTLELKHRHSNLKSLESLIEFLENYSELPIYYCNRYLLLYYCKLKNIKTINIKIDIKAIIESI